MGRITVPPVAGTTSTPVVSNLPTYASTATKTYEPARALYNVKPSNTRRTRKAIGRAGRADNGNAAGVFNDLWIGDSILGGCTGLGLGTAGSDRFDRLNTVAHFTARVMSARTGIPVAGTGLMRIHDGTRWDARFTLNATATGANTGAGAQVFLPAGATVTYTTVAATDIIRVTYYDNFSGTTGFKVAVNGATSGTGFAQPSGTGPSQWKTVTLTNGSTWAAGATVVITGIASGNTMVIAHLEATISSGGITPHNACGSGTGTSDWANIAGGGGFNLLRTQHESPLMLPYEYDRVHIAFGLFDGTSGVTIANYKANMQVIHDYFPNSDIVIHNMPTPGQLAGGSTWTPYQTANFELADTWDCPLVDFQAITGGYTVAAAAGLTADTTAHYLQPAYEMWGVTTAALI